MELNQESQIDARKKLYFLFLSAVATWCLMIVMTPILAHFNYKFGAGLSYFFFSKICHQIPERSFFIFGKQFAVCSRCTGLYFGFLLSTAIYPFIIKFDKNWIPETKMLIIAAIPIAIDISIRFAQIAENTFTTRLITGLILGAATPFFVLPGILSLAKRKMQTS